MNQLMIDYKTCHSQEMTIITLEGLIYHKCFLCGKTEPITDKEASFSEILDMEVKP